MNLLFVTTFTIVFAILFAYRNKWQFEEQTFNIDKRIIANKKWHQFQAALQFWCIFAVISMQPDISFTPRALFDKGLLLVICFFIFWILFDGMLQYIRGKEILSLGSSAIDKYFDKFKHGRILMISAKLIGITSLVLLYALV